jgi:hypothetical protein
MKKTLYVHRPLLNSDELIAWAKSQGFGKTLTADDMHVTLAYSRAEVDWDKIKPNDVGFNVVGGKRSVSPLGDKGAVVLHFQSKVLADRWKEFCDAGASWDYEGYKSHVTITYDGKNLDMSSITPYSGRLVFGGEVFAPLDEDWKPKEK